MVEALGLWADYPGSTLSRDECRAAAFSKLVNSPTVVLSSDLYT